jgi:hypothetical protein
MVIDLGSQRRSSFGVKRRYLELRDKCCEDGKKRRGT